MALFVVFSFDLCMAHATKFLNLAAQCASAGSYPLSHDPSVNRAARATKICCSGMGQINALMQCKVFRG